MSDNTHVRNINNWTVFSALILIALLVFHDAFNHDFITYDDHLYLDAIASHDTGLYDLFKWSLSSIVNSNWHPLTVLSLFIDYKLYGLDAGGYHATSLTLHILSAFLVFLIAHILTGRSIPSFLIAIIFLVHPLNVETFAWIGERKGVLAGFFTLASIYAYLRYSDTTKIRYYLIAAICLSLALMSKAIVATLPFVFLIIDIYLATLRQTDINLSFLLKRTLRLLPFFLISLVIGIITIFVFRSGEALGVNDFFSIQTRIGKMLAYFPVYLGQFFYPINLRIPYPYEVPNALQIAGGALICTTLTILALAYRKRFPLGFLGWFWYVFLLLPISGLLQVSYFAHADRYAYTPLIGFMIASVAGVDNLLQRVNARKLISMSIAILVIIILTALSWIQHSYWKNTLSLFYNTYSIDENNYLANMMLSTIYISADDLENGMKHYRLCRNKEPLYLELYSNTFHALINKNQTESALSVMKDAMYVIDKGLANPRIQIQRTKFENGVILIFTTYGKYLVEQGKHTAASEVLAKGLGIVPGNSELRYLQAFNSMSSGNLEQAESELKAILANQPMYRPAYELLQKIHPQQKP